VIVGAFAVAAIVLVQGAGVAEAAPNPPGEPADANRDFVAQGVGNLASGIFRVSRWVDPLAARHSIVPPALGRVGRRSSAECGWR
jgi:hypothetical protein